MSVIWPTLDGVVDPQEYDTRVDDAAHPALCYPRDGGILVEFYYGFDGHSFNFGFRKIKPCTTKAVQIRLDPDRNGAEVGDLTLTVRPVDELYMYGVYEGLTSASPVCGTPPDSRRAGVKAKCSKDGDAEVWLDLASQYKNGLTPNPLEPEMAVHMAIQVEVAGKTVTNFVNGVVPTMGRQQMDLQFD